MRIRGPSSAEVIELADWLEAFMLVRKLRKSSRSRIRRYMKSLLQIEGEDLQLQIDLLLQEISRRRQIAGAAYPFDEYQNGVLHNGAKGELPYIFLLCLSQSEPLRSEGRQNDVEELFDRLVMDALLNYLSGESLAEHFGWPTTGERPPNFEAALHWLADKLGLKVGKAKIRKEKKDGGVDVVVWRPFRDKREGFIIILGQCTIAFDWEKKAKDITIDLWRGYLDFGKDPIACLAVPFVIPQVFDKWDELRRTVHFVLDRLRLCELLENADLTQQDDLSQWTTNELNAMGHG